VLLRQDGREVDIEQKERQRRREMRLQHEDHRGRRAGERHQDARRTGVGNQPGDDADGERASGEMPRPFGTAGQPRPQRGLQCGRRVFDQ
jgi:hypothetical protein